MATPTWATANHAVTASASTSAEMNAIQKRSDSDLRMSIIGRPPAWRLTCRHFLGTCSSDGSSFFFVLSWIASRSASASERGVKAIHYEEPLVGLHRLSRGHVLLQRLCEAHG